MAVEIERKFRVTGDAWRNDSGVLYRQGYLNRDKVRTVRIRIAGSAAFLTIKGKSTGATRAEFEYPVPMDDAQALLALCDGPLIEKTRYIVLHAGHRWEVDEFAGDNAGLVVAELELSAEDEAFERPAWLGEEVTHDARYFNSNLATQPFCTWGA
ncbi:Inorganic triphosphatase [Curvibacter sp. AEP1-3]|uniref:CYTH domain-containing protein n=1 Tax=Curvibacter sp. AEP1-3 TaxID=1844971 RepID=UPI000B3C3A4C|nr:CYTH domain-containing protein [Curvibacter sp. AEP1-3]ARV19846.1 Inorganic triphosphatase [Curvibacter sp. AEP1-3]